MVDYTNESTNFYFNASVRPTEKLTLTGSVLYNLSKAEQDEVVMPDVTAEVIADLKEQHFTFENMHTYSDLEYKYLQFGLGLDYKIQKDFAFTTEFNYMDLTDEKGWVFGDQSGSLIMIHSGISVQF